MADYPRVLLGDFGMARKCPQGSSMNTMCGTLAYMAPEVLDAKYDQSPGYDHSADCWSLGVTLYRILSDAHPFTSNGGTSDEATIRNDLRNKVLEFPQCDWGRISIEARALIRHLLVHDPEQRWSVEDALNSEWIRMDEVWLEHRYRESVLLHWIKSSLHLNVVAKRAAPDPLEDDSLRKRARTEQTDSHSVRTQTFIRETWEHRPPPRCMYQTSPMTERRDTFRKTRLAIDVMSSKP
ncbi:kinase-like domain-containing protein [Mortierella sp. GBAus27b]|nr:kinase-like domain-containing protein [Mortierella sp. GBAus27b]